MRGIQRFWLSRAHLVGGRAGAESWTEAMLKWIVLPIYRIVYIYIHIYILKYGWNMCEIYIYTYKYTHIICIYTCISDIVSWLDSAFFFRDRGSWKTLHFRAPQTALVTLNFATFVADSNPLSILRTRTCKTFTLPSIGGSNRWFLGWFFYPAS